MLDCRLGVDEQASVGEAVGRDVEDAHDGRPRPALLERRLRHGADLAPSDCARIASHETSTSNTGPLGQPRGIGFAILLTIITLGIYCLYWVFKTQEEVKNHSGEGVGGVLGLVIYIVVGIVTWFLIPSEVGKMFKEDGRIPPLTGGRGYGCSCRSSGRSCGS